MGKISRQVYEAALKLRAPELAPFLEWVREERREAMEKLITAPADRLPILQGEARQLSAILNLVDIAPAMLDEKEGVIARFFK